MHTKLTNKLTKQIADAIKGGAYAERAASAAGIHESTFYRWLKEGTDDIEAGKATLHANFALAIAQADATSENDAAAGLLNFRSHDNPKIALQATVQYLARRWPERWSPTRKVDLTGEVGTGALPDVRIVVGIPWQESQAGFRTLLDHIYKRDGFALEGWPDDALDLLQAAIEEQHRINKQARI